jgi:type I restriction enzyme M protein
VNAQNSPSWCQSRKLSITRYDLSINKYKKVEYKPVEYPPTSEIMANIRSLEVEITEDLNDLEKMLTDETN